MAYFNSYKPLLQQVEAGFQKLPKDRGNYNSRGELAGTNFGVSARFYEDILGYPPTEADMRAITKSQAEEIFKKYFWDANWGNQINSQAAANTVIDHEINAGNGVALAQQVLNRYFGYHLSVDDAMGPNTLRAINGVNASEFVKKYNEARADYYRSLNSSFLPVWLRRIQQFAVENTGISVITVLTVAVAGMLIYQHIKS
ncbi:MAG: glycosyl hydrolase 108 family protein [Salinimicrobium sp.]